MSARILKTDRFQKGENVLGCEYVSAREAIKKIHHDLFQ